MAAVTPTPTPILADVVMPVLPTAAAGSVVEVGAAEVVEAVFGELLVAEGVELVEAAEDVLESLAASVGDEVFGLEEEVAGGAVVAGGVVAGVVGWADGAAEVVGTAAAGGGGTAVAHMALTALVTVGA
jgi:hypothetical protein